MNSNRRKVRLPSGALAAFPERGAAIKISDGGTRPFWDHAGDALYYIGNQDALMRVDFDAGETPRVGTPERVADLPRQLAPSTWRSWGGIAPDGRMLLVRRNEPTLTQIDVVLNWFEELRRISPPD